MSCPRSAEEVADACEAADHATLQSPSSCGGSVVLVQRGSATTEYYFDASDRLAGIRNSTAASECDTEPSYGHVCQPTGMVIDRCSSSCVLGSLEDYCASEGDCPSSPDDVKVTCNDETRTYRMGNACGGVNLHLVVVGSVGWSFDGNGRLVGVLGAYDAPHHCGGKTLGGVYGTFCKATDDATDLCAAP